MDEQNLNTLLNNYHELVLKVDTYAHHVEDTYKDSIICQKGCDDCCKPLSLFPVEAMAISLACSQLSDPVKKQVQDRIKNNKGHCPLLINSECALYPARPIICRTHGYPIYMEKDNKPYIDFCPENFKDIKSFPKTALLNLEHLNTTLSAVNQHFLKRIETDTQLPERITISQALFIISG